MWPNSIAMLELTPDSPCWNSRQPTRSGSPSSSGGWSADTCPRAASRCPRSDPPAPVATSTSIVSALVTASTDHAWRSRRVSVARCLAQGHRTNGSSGAGSAEWPRWLEPSTSRRRHPLSGSRGLRVMTPRSWRQATLTLARPWSVRHRGTASWCSSSACAAGVRRANSRRHRSDRERWCHRCDDRGEPSCELPGDCQTPPSTCSLARCAASPD